MQHPNQDTAATSRTTGTSASAPRRKSRARKDVALSAVGFVPLDAAQQDEAFRAIHQLIAAACGAPESALAPVSLLNPSHLASILRPMSNGTSTVFDHIAASVAEPQSKPSGRPLRLTDAA